MAASLPHENASVLKSDECHSQPVEHRELLNLLKLLQNGDSKRTPADEEESALVKFSTRYRKTAQFSRHVHRSQFSDVMCALTTGRLLNEEFMSQASPVKVLRILVCLRILVRDSLHQIQFLKLDGVRGICKCLEIFSLAYLSRQDSGINVDILKEITNICYKFSVTGHECEALTVNGVHKYLVMLLMANDVSLLQSVLRVLISLSRSEKSKKLIVSVDSTIDSLLHILQNYEMVSRELAAQLLRYISNEPEVKELIKVCGGIPIMLSLLQCGSMRLLWNIVWCLVMLSSDTDISNELRIVGGIPLLLAMLHETRFQSTELASLSSGSTLDRPAKQTDGTDLTETAGEVSIKAACCACLTELVVNDANGHQVVQNNGIYHLALLTLPPPPTSSSDSKHYNALVSLQAYAFRCLRFLFSFERNRRHFKSLLPANVFESFIDIGHYNRDISAYRKLATTLNSLPQHVLEEIRCSVDNCNQNRAASRSIGKYDVIEVLGSGAFGTVYKVRKRSGQTFFAMKELNTVVWGSTSRERQTSVGDAINELAIIREQLKHPNIVRYFKTFISDDKLYIVMEMIEGATLGEHITSLKEKKEKFSEAQIWKIFMQMLLALRYLHKEKGIVHRDLTPNNVMMDEGFKVTVTDFGLAKQKRADCSKMNSVVGTILCSCPEIIQNLPYGEKADIWSLGCLLYQMCALKPPFYSSNMLTLAKMIVNATYEPLPAGEFSPLISSTIRICLTSKEAERPDIVGVAAHVADILLTNLDSKQHEKIHLEKKLEQECKKTQKYLHDSTTRMLSYHSSNQLQTWLQNSTPDSNLESSAEKSRNSTGSSSSIVRSQSMPGSSLLERSSTSLADIECESLTDLAKSQCSSIPFVNVSPSAEDVDDGSDSGFVVAAATGHAVGGNKMFYRRPQFLSVSSGPSSLVSGASKCPSPVSILPGKIREITDPVLQILEQIHRIVFITQLPPTLYPSPRRRLVELFKRNLFEQRSSASNLKNELHKLATGSRDIVDLPAAVVSKLVVEISRERETNLPNSAAGVDYELEMSADVGLTYEHLQSIIDSLLAEVGYANSPAVRSSSRAPHYAVAGRSVGAAAAESSSSSANSKF